MIERIITPMGVRYRVSDKSGRTVFDMWVIRKDAPTMSDYKRMKSWAERDARAVARRCKHPWITKLVSTISRRG